MKRFTPNLREQRPADVVLEDLNELFKKPWRDRISEASDMVASLRTEANLLRWFVAKVGRRREWPKLTGAQSFTLFSSETMLARINLWFPLPNDASDSYRRYLSIEEIHNHDFDFFTTCLFGPGYVSTFWQDPTFHDRRRVGERIDLTQREVHQLQGDEVWFVEASTDFHAQHAPPAFSVTLNVLPNWLERPTTIQYVLDEQHRIKTVIDSALPPVDVAA